MGTSSRLADRAALVNSADPQIIRRGRSFEWRPRPAIVAKAPGHRGDVAGALAKRLLDVETAAYFSHIIFRGALRFNVEWYADVLVGVRPSLDSEACDLVPKAGMSAMGWSADLQRRAITVDQRPISDSRVLRSVAPKPPVGRPHRQSHVS